MPPKRPTRRRKPSGKKRRRADAPGLRAAGQRFLDLGLDDLFQVLRRDRPDHLVGDLAVAADDESLRHAVDAPFDCGAAADVRARGDEGIAVATEEAARRVVLILVVEADDPDTLVLGE